MFLAIVKHIVTPMRGFHWMKNEWVTIFPPTIFVKVFRAFLTEMSSLSLTAAAITLQRNTCPTIQKQENVLKFLD